MPHRLRSGDVLEVEFPKVPSPSVAFPDGGFGYLTYVGKHHHNGDAVRVCPRVFHEQPEITDGLFVDSYIAFYPANVALVHKLVRVVGRLAPVAMPTTFRRGPFKLGEVTLPYQIDVYNGKECKTYLKYSLSEEEKNLNMATVYNHEALLCTISQGWRPQWDCDDVVPPPGTEAPGEGVLLTYPPPDSSESTDPPSAATQNADSSVLEELAQTSELAIPRGIRHYLYLPTKKIAQQVASTLQKRDFVVELERSAMGKKWLVRASHRVVLSGEYIANMRTFLEELVEPLHGEYDGWEVEVVPQKTSGVPD